MQTVCITRPLPCYTSSGADGYGRLRTPNRGSPLVLNGARRPFVTVTALFGGNKPTASGKGCFKCKGKGAIECKGCQGTGKNKKNGNIFERWKCYDCQGFGLVGCANCGTGGLTPEQRGER